jgi:hypothetical protein
LKDIIPNKPTFKEYLDNRKGRNDVLSIRSKVLRDYSDRLLGKIRKTTELKQLIKETEQRM